MQQCYHIAHIVTILLNPFQTLIMFEAQSTHVDILYVTENLFLICGNFSFTLHFRHGSGEVIWHGEKWNGNKNSSVDDELITATSLTTLISHQWTLSLTGQIHPKKKKLIMIFIWGDILVERCGCYSLWTNWKDGRDRDTVGGNGEEQPNTEEKGLVTFLSFRGWQLVNGLTC